MAKSTFSKECMIMNTTKLHGIPTQVTSFNFVAELLTHELYVGCLLDPNATFTGTIPVCLSIILQPILSLELNQNDNGVNRTNCDANSDSNSGCDVVEWSRASYGPYFEAQGGGVLAMKWDENDISVCERPFTSLFKKKFTNKEHQGPSSVRQFLRMSRRGHPIHHHGAYRPLCSTILYAISASILHGTQLFSVRLNSYSLANANTVTDSDAGLDITFCGLFCRTLSRN